MKTRVCGIILVIIFIFVACNGKQPDHQSVTNNPTKPISGEEAAERVEETEENPIKDKSVEDILAKLTLDEKAAQMVQGAVYSISENSMKQYCYGSVLSTYGTSSLNSDEWKSLILTLQKSATKSEAGIPYLYGNDAVHGVNTCEGAVIFPHNIGIGAAKDKELTYQMGLAVANEAKLTGMLWSFSPCIAAAKDPRWGRTYECYSSETEITSELGSAFAGGMIEGGILPCAKHFFADGNVAYGTGEDLDGTNRLIDRGDARLSEEEIKEQLAVYQKMIDTGVKTIMVSHSSLNGVKMHENEKYISILKNEMNFDGFLVSDWNSIHNISGKNLKEKTIKTINAGIDMLMEDTAYEECRGYIVEGVNEGSISMERVDDAVSRILTVKKEMGILEDPMMEKVTTTVDQVGSKEYHRDLAKMLVEESLVLLKNNSAILPIKKGTKIFVTGPAANDVGVQCGGWTITWSGRTDKENNGKWIPEGTTILDGLYELEEKYDLTIISDKKAAADADMTLLCLGEKPYAEWEGDSADISITGELGLPGNQDAIKLAKKLGHPTVTCIVAGRNVILGEEMKQWDSIVLCYLPGSEGNGIANVLLGQSGFKGTLPMPYYSSTTDIGTNNVLYPVGYGLKYQ